MQKTEIADREIILLSCLTTLNLLSWLQKLKFKMIFNSHFNCVLPLLPCKLEYRSEIRGFIIAMFLCFLRRIHMNNQYTVMKWNTWVVDFSDSNFTGSKNKESFLSMHVYKIDMVVYYIEIFLNSHGPRLWLVYK